MMIDFKAINRGTDIMILAGNNLKQVSASEYAGPCPFCGGTDRFHVKPDDGIWFCRNCTDGRFYDSIDLYRRIKNISVAQAARELSEGHTPMATGATPYKPVLNVAKAPPNEDWQAVAEKIISHCEKALWSTAGEAARRWLYEVKGLNDGTIKKFRLGFCTGGYEGSCWIAGKKVAGGIVIPWLNVEKVWKLQVRRVWGDILGIDVGGSIRNKYWQIASGQQKALFNADDLNGRQKAIIVEGELDAMSAWQEMRSTGVAVISIGSKSNCDIDLKTWAASFLVLTDIGVLMDCDGESEAAAEKLVNMFAVAHRIMVPIGKDPTSFRMAGGNIRQWLTNEMGIEAITIVWPAGTKATLTNRAKTLADGRIECRYSSRLALAEAMLPILQGNERDAVAGQIYIEWLKMGVNSDSILI